MSSLLLPVLLFAAAKEPPAGPPRESPPEYGHGLTREQAAAGWLALYDGSTDFGWTGATVKDGVLTGGVTTTHFGPCEVRMEVAHGGTVQVGDQSRKAEAGSVSITLEPTKAGPVRLADGLAVRKLAVLPTGLADKFTGKDLTGWKVLHHPRLPEDKRAKWTVADGAVRAVGGPGALELQEQFADFVLRVEVRAKAKMANGGVFVRTDPGSFMNGYEAQVYNGCYDGDPGKPARYSTGAIDDRQLARRLVSRDGEWFTMTVIATGPHLATWVNGYQTTDWTDTRPKDPNPRKGLRLEAGTVQLQAHDPETDVEFRRLRVVELGATEPKK